jgi:hypothetical protein
MDTSAFILERQKIRESMEAQRVYVGQEAEGEKSAWWKIALSVGMQWGLFPLVQETALAGIRHWVLSTAQRMRSKL